MHAAPHLQTAIALVRLSDLYGPPRRIVDHFLRAWKAHGSGRPCDLINAYRAYKRNQLEEVPDFVRKALQELSSKGA